MIARLCYATSCSSGSGTTTRAGAIATAGGGAEPAEHEEAEPSLPERSHSGLKVNNSNCFKCHGILGLISTSSVPNKGILFQ